ncbi:MAG: lipoate--protein ligase [Marinifilaceae bacterium]|jgi:lipoate-protein ligase A|nr:lipoate--protein ligase [Marinifilaceae bacterium]
MHLLKSNTNCPYFNIAAEEYILNKTNMDVLFVYQNDRAVVIGKHQNVFAELDLNKCFESGVNLVRRLSGGGAVYHDKGNLNFSFLYTKKTDYPDKIEDRYLSIINCLEKIGLKLEFKNSNSIYVDGLKISGNSTHISKNRVIQHGTLLIESDLSELNKLLKPKFKFEHKAVDSIRSQVGNIKDLTGLGLVKIEELIIEEFKKNSNQFKELRLNKYDELEVHNLVKTKYRSWEWNYEYSANSILESEYHEKDKQFKIQLRISKSRLISVLVKDIESNINEEIEIKESIKLPIFIFSSCQKKLEIIKEELSFKLNNKHLIEKISNMLMEM